MNFDRKGFRAALDQRGYNGITFKSRTVSFEDLARASSIFVYMSERVRPEDYEAIAASARAAGAILSE